MINFKWTFGAVGVLYLAAVGCKPSVDDGDVATLTVVQSGPITLEGIRNDIRVRIFVERFMRDERRAVATHYDLKDVYLIPNRAACRYEIEVRTTTEETYSLSVDLQRDGSMEMPLAKFVVRGATLSQAIDTSRFVEGPLDDVGGDEAIATILPAAPSQATGQTPGAPATLQPSLRPTPQAASSNEQSLSLSGGSQSNSSGTVIANVRSSTRSDDVDPLSTRRRDPNENQLEAFVADWVKKEHRTELDTFLIRGREPTTFNASRYHTIITTDDDSGFEVTVDVYHNGEFRIFRSRKTF